jgi:TPR repeat protein
MYDNGEGVPEDDEEAVKWYRLAAKRGVIAAQARLDEM